jgi:site-specific recombinase XerD
MENAIDLDSATSNRGKSLFYFVRLQAILEECDPAEVPAYKSRFSRKWFADQIGCSPATLTSSPRLRKELGLWEEKNRKRMVLSVPCLDGDDTNVVPFKRPKPEGDIFKVPVEVKKLTRTVPTLLWIDGMDDWIADYARHLIFVSKSACSSVEQTVTKLRIFRRFQRLHRLPSNQINDDFLLAWQHDMANRGISGKRSDECVSCVHDMLKWAENRGLLKHHVQMALKHEYQDLPEDYIFPVSSEKRTVQGRHGQSYDKWVSTLTGSASHSTYGMRNTPTSQQTLKLGEIVELHTRNNVRNKLIMDWALFTGARVSEIVQIKDSDIPRMDSILDALYDQNGDLAYTEVKVKRKNRGSSSLRVPSDLILRTAEYIECDEERLKIIEDSEHSQTNDRPVFLSEKKGALTTDSVTRIFRHFFKKAGITKANIHRLRARYITTVIELQLDRFASGNPEYDPTSNWQETVLRMAVQLMGHSHPMSLLPYLNEILQRRATKDGRVEPRSIEERERSLNDLEKQMGGRFAHHARVAKAVRLESEGRL